MAWPFFDVELNRTAAFFYVATFLLTCAALVQPSWFKTTGGMHCCLAPSHAISSEVFEREDYTSQIITSGVNVRTPYLGLYMDTFPCITPKIASLLRVLILLCILILMLSLVGIFINLSVSTHHFIKTIRRNAVPSILCVLWVITIIGISYYITVMLELEAERISGEPVYVTYEYGFYTITVAGGFALLACAANLWDEFTSRVGDIQRRNLVEDWDERNDTERGQSSLPPYSARPPSFLPRMMRQGRVERTAPTNIETYYPFDDLAALPPPPPYTP